MKGRRREEREGADGSKEVISEGKGMLAKTKDRKNREHRIIKRGRKTRRGR